MVVATSGIIKSSEGHFNFEIFFFFFFGFQRELTCRIWMSVWISGERNDLKYIFEGNLPLVFKSPVTGGDELGS